MPLKNNYEGSNIQKGLKQALEWIVCHWDPQKWTQHEKLGLDKMYEGPTLSESQISALFVPYLSHFRPNVNYLQPPGESNEPHAHF